ncbi:hypothetical protein KXQ82_02100 [Mucilaginibacter sp. HMF5004]|uniref:hypothetical protein n=1 Tax=Mucilaginibacter rivuli TaxID=2857527 RepID=UPI001C5DDEC6|nr:hypothetical protein [Mucilaginibacter rivuli]MBW4888483.1 hypothetical protein [Mucilaginibacter rivuli]
MKTKNHLLVLLIMLSFNAFSQSQWLRLNYPQSNILGKGVISYRAGEITFKLDGDNIENPQIDNSISADELSEYNQEYKNFITKYFSINRYKITQVKAKKMVIKSLNYVSLLKMNVGSNYVYSGLSADSVEVTVKTRKDNKFNYSKVLKDVTSIITAGQEVSIVSKIIPLLDSISSESKDSVSYKMLVANPDVFYKVKIVKLLNGSSHDWNKYFLYFSSNLHVRDDGQNAPTNIDSTFELEWTPNETRNASYSRYPEFWGKDRKDVEFRLLTKKISNDLRLFISYKSGKFSNNWVNIEVPYSVIDNKRYWNMDRQLVYTFEFKNVIKLVYVQIRAYQKNDNVITIISSDSGDKQTFMQYPEVSLEYIKG